jgi:hypothetical protein
MSCNMCMCFSLSTSSARSAQTIAHPPTQATGPYAPLNRIVSHRIALNRIATACICIRFTKHSNSLASYSPALGNMATKRFCICIVCLIMSRTNEWKKRRECIVAKNIDRWREHSRETHFGIVADRSGMQLPQRALHHR